MTRAILWDSSVILALLDADDADHARAVAVAFQIASDGRLSFITNYIEVEAHALLVRKLGRTIAREWLLTGRLPVVRALPADEERAREIVTRHTDKDWTCAMRSPSRPRGAPHREGLHVRPPVPTLRPFAGPWLGRVMMLRPSFDAVPSWPRGVCTQSPASAPCPILAIVNRGRLPNEEMCRYQQTPPESHFTRNLGCSLATRDGRITISGMRLIRTTDDDRQEWQLSS